LERYKGYRVPIAWVKTGSILKKLADREQTTSAEILDNVTKEDLDGPKDIGPLSSTKELLEALDLALGSEEDDLEGHGPQEPKITSTEAETEDNTAAAVPLRKKRRTKLEMQAAAAGRVGHEPRFVELTKLLPLVPKKGNFDVDSVRKSLYFFS
jgi:DNA-directed RNA polymerase